MSPDDVLMLKDAAIVLGIIGTWYLWWWARTCRCEQCAFHANERRMAALKQAEWNHDLEHKGPGFRPTTHDRYDCPTKGCPRNRKGVDLDDA